MADAPDKNSADPGLTPPALAEKIRQREELILGKPSRMAPPTDLTDELRALAATPPGYGRPGELVENFAIMLHTPELVRIYREIGVYFLTKGTLAPRDREVAILRVGWLCQAPYEWGEHVGVSKRRAGLTTEEIERYRQGPSAAGLSPRDRIILQVVDELFHGAMVCDETWDLLRGEFEDRQVIEILNLIGLYQALAYFQNSLRVRLREGNEGLGAL
jgi:alkylhydroperoxidase family enzyme